MVWVWRFSKSSRLGLLLVGTEVCVEHQELFISWLLHLNLRRSQEHELGLPGCFPYSLQLLRFPKSGSINEPDLSGECRVSVVSWKSPADEVVHYWRPQSHLCSALSSALIQLRWGFGEGCCICYPLWVLVGFVFRSLLSPSRCCRPGAGGVAAAFFFFLSLWIGSACLKSV